MRPDAMAGPIARSFNPPNGSLASPPFAAEPCGELCPGAANGDNNKNASTARIIGMVASLWKKISMFLRGVRGRHSESCPVAQGKSNSNSRRGWPQAVLEDVENRG